MTKVIQTMYGPVQGVQEGKLVVFRGIPYAQPPVGDLRWKPPMPIDRWSTPLIANKFGFACPQPENPAETASMMPQSEDCLTVNVWTPETDSSKRPVLVWIHGGSFTWGSSSDPLYSGHAIAERGDVVCITINYRLGVFGQLYLGDLGGPDYMVSANLGVLDQEMALRWVRDNIHVFGGDPDNVTLFGQSSGGVSISALLGMPSAKGLFHKAVIQSNGPSLFRTMDFSKETARRFMSFADTENFEAFKALSTEDLVCLELAFIENQPFLSDYFFQPAVDGIVLPKPTLHSLLTDKGTDVPLLTGSSAHELTIWGHSLPELMSMMPNDFIEVRPWYKAFLEKHFEDYTKNVIGDYSSRRKEQPPNDILIASETDCFFRIPLIRLAEVYEKALQSNVYMYLFTYESQADKYLRATHGMELPFLFRNFGDEFSKEVVGPNPPPQLADVVQDAWIAFARTGDPNNENLPSWPAYDTEKRATLLFNLSPEVALDPFGEDRKVWDHIPFDSLDPTVTWPD